MLLLGVLICVLLSLSTVQGKGSPPPPLVYCRTRRLPPFNPGAVDVVFLLNSNYMPSAGTSPPAGTQGFRSQRFEFWKLVIEDIVSELPLNQDGIRVGVLQFTANEADEAIELGATSDTATFNNLLDALTETSTGSSPNHENVILDAIMELKPDGHFGARSYASKLLFFLSDSDTASTDTAREEAVDRASAAGIIFVGIIPMGDALNGIDDTVSPTTSGLTAQAAQEVANLAYEDAYLQCVLQCPEAQQISYTDLLTVDGSIGITNPSQAISCSDGFSNNSTAVTTLQCNPEGAWPILPSCDIVECPLVSITDGAIVFANGRSYQDRSIYTCDEGFNLNRHPVRMCQADMTWEDTVTPTCSVVTCPPISVDGGDIVFTDDQNFGSVASYSCFNGNTLDMVTTTRTCLEDGEWSGYNPACTTSDCGHPGVVGNAGVYFDSTTVGSRANFTCNKGFMRTSGSEMRICQANGIWSGTPPVCSAIDCGEPGDITNANKRFSTTTFGSVASYSCLAGYTAAGFPLATCDSAGQWSGATLTCSAVMCRSLASPNFGTVATSTGDNSIGAIATYSCDTGYELVGSETRECLVSGQWTSSMPYCRVVSCSIPSEIERGGVTTPGGTNYQAVITYFCNTGSELQGNPTRVCQSDGTWAGSEPTCVEIDCGDPGDLVDGSNDLTDGTIYQSVVTYQCDTGYTLVGIDTRVCQETGLWSGDAPTCSVVDCGAPPPIENGNIDTSSGTTFGLQITYTCQSGFVRQGLETRTCQDDGTWGGDEPTCQRISCGFLSSVDNGDLVLDQGTLYQSIASHVCDDGYSLSGNTDRSCLFTEIWSGSTPTCQVIDCGPLSDIANGEVDTTHGSTFLSVASYSCEEGYRLEGNSLRECLDTSQWSGDEPECTIVDCSGYLPDAPDNGMLDSSQGTQYQMSITFTCDTGYSLVGSPTRTCQADGSWSGESPFCEIVDCGGVDTIENGDIFYSYGTQWRSLVSYSCNTGYQLVGDPVRICQHTGIWNGTAPECQILDCLMPPSVMYASSSYNNSVYKSVAEYQCNEGFNLDGPFLISCDYSGTWTTPPTCNIVTCLPLENPENGYVTFNSTEYLSRTNYSCSEGYTLIGAEYRVCQANGKWTGSSSGDPFCQIISCGGLDEIANGGIRYSSGTYYNSTATHYCDQGYKVVGSGTRTCQPDGTWSGITTSCEICDCAGVLDDVPSGYAEVSRGTTYGSLIEYRCDEGYEIGSNALRICGAGDVLVGTMPTCSISTCKVEQPLNGTASPADSVLFDETVSYSCDVGYTLEGDSNKTCEAYGCLSGYQVNCQIVSCGGLMPERNGDVVLSGTTSGSTAYYACNTGYQRTISTDATCSTNGDWMLSSTCNAVDCSVPSMVENGTVVYKDTEYEGVAFYECDIGFDLIGCPLRTCLGNGTWSGVDPFCLIRDCGLVPDIQNGQIDYSDGTNYTDQIVYSCDIGYDLIGYDVRTCQHTRMWSGEAPVCQIVDCGLLDPVRDENSSSPMYPMGTTTYASQATHSCRPGFEIIAGAMIRTCMADGFWSGMPPVCERPLPPMNVSVEVFNGTHVLLTFDYSQGVSRDCQVVYYRVATQADSSGIVALPPDSDQVIGNEENRIGDIIMVDLPQNDTSVFLEIPEAGAYVFRVRCQNMEGGFTNFSAAGTAELSTEPPCTDIFDCNPALIYAIAIPCAIIVVAVLAALAIYLGVKLSKAGKKPNTDSPTGLVIAGPAADA